MHQAWLSVAAVLSSFATAALTSGTGPGTTVPRAPAAPFSFAQWVEDIIATPEKALTPEQAVEAWNATVATMDPRVLEKRVICNNVAGTEASVPDAVICINFLAALGDYRCETSTVSQFAYSGSNPGARIVGVGAGGGGVSSSRCQDVARTAGQIMDSCTRADGLVQGVEQNPWATGVGMAVHIRKV
ncbi:hypothetical protein RB595_007937 [Gaeumannomyces hyphopodioides]